MDRLKFRAWFRDRWLHGYEKLGGCSIAGETMIIGGWLSEVKLKDLNEVVIEQCTGLKDKNGKLIYEGDIVECWFQETNLRYVDIIDSDGRDQSTWDGWSGSELEAGDGNDQWIFSKHVGTVEWSSDTINVGPSVRGEGGIWYDEMGTNFSYDKLEVIGNIHENPELLSD
jgi:uncharacterized phage protein (TIGR01671 family)